MSVTKHLILVRLHSMKINDKTTKDFVTWCLDQSFKDRRGTNWDYKLKSYETERRSEKEPWVFRYDVTLTKLGATATTDKIDKQFSEIKKALETAGKNAKFNKYPWFVLSDWKELDGLMGNLDGSEPKVEIPTINIDKKNYFDHLYQREHQIEIIHSAIRAAVDTDFEDRHHCVLFGPPATGKTDILLSLGKMVGNENEHYMVFDATSLTEAGVTKVLQDATVVPPIMIIEEIEKAEEKSLRWMLGVLDQRAEIRRTNYRVGNLRVGVRCLVLATVNNMDLFRQQLAGALASRFSLEVHCPRPDRQLLSKILEREVKRVNGNLDWIEPALKLCHDQYKINDPRKIVPVCLCGREKLLTGEYQKAYMATRQPGDGIIGQI